MYRQNWILSLIVLMALVTVVAHAEDGKLLHGKKVTRQIEPGHDEVVHRCLTPSVESRITFPVERKEAWSLPTQALAADYTRNVKILVLRYNFQFETEDDLNTTGRGHMDLTADSAAFFDQYGHYIDPPPRDSAYFDAHMQALNMYWNRVSEGKLNLTWDIYPPANDSIYELPHEMGYYGACTDTLSADTSLEAIVHGLERYFIDAIRMADTISPEIDFSQYESVFLFHAGADQQNNIGFPPTCSDLFTGYIRFGDSIQADDGTIFLGGIPVDNGTSHIKTALMMPETASQDNRSTALNAVMAHEFGHQLGLVDLYRTGRFRTQLGDFALMDNNGFGTGIEFGGFLGKTFGANPVFPCAWSRAYLGFVDVVDYRKGDDIRLVAAEIVSDGVKIARVPISDDEYYLIENRLQDFDNKLTFMLADSVTSVIWGPADIIIEGSDTLKNLSYEYDHLMPGSGVLIYHVDESVAREDWGGTRGVNNFYDNQLQLDPYRRFIRIVEADGVVDFGGYYNAGYGSPEDMYRDDRNSSLTPNTNPPSIDNTGNNSHVRITNITRDSTLVGFSFEKVDSVVFFDIETDGLVDNFPARIGYRFSSGAVFNATDTIVGKFQGANVIADDLDRDGVDEIITASNFVVQAITNDGENFYHRYLGCDPCSTYYDYAHSRYDGLNLNFIDSAIYGRDSAYPTPALFTTGQNLITVGPVTGDFGNPAADKMVAVGYLTGVDSGGVNLHALFLQPDDLGLADTLKWFLTSGWPTHLSFGERLYSVTSTNHLYYYDSFSSSSVAEVVLEVDTVYGACRSGLSLVMLADSAGQSQLVHFVDDSIITYNLPLYCDLGPILADINRDSIPEIIAASFDGNLVVISMDITDLLQPKFSELAIRSSGYEFSSRPVIGDVDLDGYADVVIGGVGQFFAFDSRLHEKIGFPRQINDRFPDDYVNASPVIGNLNDMDLPEIIFPTIIGNMYSFGDELSYGFPLSAGEVSHGSALIFNDSGNIKLGYAGDDGWLYLWDFWAGDYDSNQVFWPMAGADPSGSFAFVSERLSEPKLLSTNLPEERFFAWPNPALDGSTNIRYYLGSEASKVTINIFDLSGTLVESFDGATGSRDHDISWECSNVTPGVYRCIIEADFGGTTEHAFTDIAVIR